MGIVFITGTDTGVGKTLFTALWLRHLRDSGCRALALKPFATGDRADARLFHALQDGELTLDEINPHFYPDPAAPLVAARLNGQGPPLAKVVQHVVAVESRCDCLLVEGAGGLLVPLGEGYCVGDLIAALCSRVVVVAANRLGVINHTRLTMEALGKYSYNQVRMVLMDTPGGMPGLANDTNARVLRELLPDAPLLEVPHFGPQATEVEAVVENAKKIKKTLVLLRDFAKFSARSKKGGSVTGQQ